MARQHARSAGQHAHRVSKPHSVEHIGISQGRVSTHLGCLSDCGYVAVRRTGRFAYYRVADPRVAELVLLARALAADNAAALAACMRVDPRASLPRGPVPRCPLTPTRTRPAEVSWLERVPGFGGWWVGCR